MIMLGGRFVAGLIFLSLFVGPAMGFSSDLELSLGVDEGGQCVKSPSRSVTVRQQPIPFCVVLANRSGSSQSVYWEAEAGGIASLSFELTNEQGKTVIVKRKEIQVRSTQVINNYLAAGASVTKTILVDPDEWENIPVIEPGQVKTIKVRAVFDNDGSNIYSGYYTVILDGR